MLAMHHFLPLLLLCASDVRFISRWMFEARNQKKCLLSALLSFFLLVTQVILMPVSQAV